MPNDPLESVYQFAERAYIRMQAGEVITRCLDASSAQPMQKMVESLVVAGPTSLYVFREALAETTSRKAQVEDDLQQVISGLKTNLQSYGFLLGTVKKPQMIIRLKPVRFLRMLRVQGVTEEEAQVTCLQLFQDARDLVSGLVAKYDLLEDVETFLEDWMMGVCFQSVRQGIEQKM
ncbi:MAG TPA: hypothetical protein VHO48_00090 [Anaerolineaceae bacterium]|nr:hypothetical protein [Anaerolineaceae bacterium]